MPNYLSASALHNVWLQVADVFMFFNFMVVPKSFNVTIMTPYHLVRHNLNRTMPRNRSHNDMMKLH